MSAACRGLRPRLLLTAALLGAGACASDPPYQRPAVVSPPAWRQGGAGTDVSDDIAWWEQFGDPVLDRLVRTTLAGSLDLKASGARVDQALALLGTAESARSPQVAAQADADRLRASRNTFQGQAIPAGRERYGALDLELTASYEIDLWGRLRHASEAARARLLASQSARQALVLSLVGSVADAYIGLRSLDRQLEVALAARDSRHEALRLQRLRFEGGLAPESDFRQAESQYEVAAAAVPALERRIAAQEDLIGVLSGSGPGAVERGLPLPALALPALPAALPAALLDRRPDLRQAEEELVAAHADVGAARAAFLPRISLTGLFGLQSAEFSTLLRRSSLAWSLGAGVAQPLLNGGALESGLRYAQAGERAAVFEYQGAVLGALRDVEDALAARRTLEQQTAEQARNVEALQRLRDLAGRRYQEGAAIYLEVSTAEQALFDAQLSLVDLQAQRFQSHVALYKALGGGWVEAAAR